MTYAWTTTGGNFAAGENTLTPTVDAPGTYLLLVTDTQNGCTASDQTLVQKDANVPTAIAQAPAPLNCLIPTALLSAVGTSQGPNFVYTWTTSGGNIVSGGNTLSPTVNAAGIYTLSVFNTVSQCTATATATVLEDRQIPAADIQSPSVLSCAMLSLSLDASGSAQGSAYAYTWAASGGGNIASGASGLSPTVDQPGTYALTVTNTQNGCTATDVVTVLKNTAIPAAVANAVGKITCTSPTLSLSGAGSATGGNFTYQWSTANGNFAAGANTLSPVVDAPGLYVLLVTDTQNGCTATDQVLVEKDANVPLAAAQAPGALTCSTAALQLSAVGTSQGAGITYLWTTSNGSIVSGSNTLAPTVNAAGTYTLQVSNTASACTAVATLTVLEDKAPPAAKAAAPSAITCKNLVVSLDGAGSSTGPNFAYLWATTSGNFVSGKNTLAPTVDQPGIYNLLITNTSNGCTATASAAVGADQTAPLAQIAPAPQLNCTIAAIQLNGLGSSSTPGLTYQWTATSGGNITSGSGSLTPTVDAPGTYTLLVSDPANGCTAQANVAVSRDVQPPIASVAPPALLNCTVAEVSLDGVGSSTGPNFALLWATTSGNFVSGKNTLSPTVNQPGAYNLLITNTSNGCMATASVTVGQDIAVPQVDAGASQTFLCNTSSLALTATATGAGTAAQITWSTLDGLILSGTNTLSPAIGSAGTYTILVKNPQNGCTQSDAVTILKDQNAPLSAAAVSGQLTCQVAQVVLNGTGSSTGAQYAYGWGMASGGIVPGGNTLSPTVSQPGVYILTVIDLGNNCTTTATVEVTEDKTPPPASAVAKDALTCKVSQVQISGSSPANVTYVWSGVGIVSGSNTPNPTVNAAGQYALVVTDLGNGCTGTASVQVLEEKTLPIVAVAPPAQLNCLVLNTLLNGAGSSTGNDFAYLWAGPGLVSGNTALQATIDEPGVYLLQVVNQATGCTASATATVTQDVQAPQAQAGGGFELTCLVEDGTLSAAGSSMGAQFAYVWSGAGIVAGANTATPKVSEPGLYTLTVRNTANGCTAVASVPVTENLSEPTGLTRSFTPPNCKGQPGSIRFEEVLGGTAPYAYSIDGGATFGTVKQFEKLSPGTYALLVQDANGCEYTEPLTLLAPVLPKLSIQPEIEVNFGEQKTLTATLNIPLSEVDTIIWSPEEGLTRTAEQNVVIAQPFRSTQYQVRVVNKDGCDDRALLTVRVDRPSIWAPNVFSPKRRDGQNDWFLIFAGEGAVRNIRTLQIFDRWGTMVFRNDDLQPNVEKMGWDGSFRGVVLQPAVFAWYAEVVLSSGEEVILKGDVTIVD